MRKLPRKDKPEKPPGEIGSDGTYDAVIVPAHPVHEKDTVQRGVFTREDQLNSEEVEENRLRAAQDRDHYPGRTSGRSVAEGTEPLKTQQIEDHPEVQKEYEARRKQEEAELKKLESERQARAKQREKEDTDRAKELDKGKGPTKT